MLRCHRLQQHRQLLVNKAHREKNNEPPAPPPKKKYEKNECTYLSLLLPIVAVSMLTIVGVRWRRPPSSTSSASTSAVHLPLFLRHWVVLLLVVLPLQDAGKQARK